LIFYFFKKSLRSFFENISLNAVSTGIISIIFIIFGIYLLIITNLNKNFGEIANNVRISVYLKKGSSDKSIKKLNI